MERIVEFPTAAGADGSTAIIQEGAVFYQDSVKIASGRSGLGILRTEAQGAAAGAGGDILDAVDIAVTFVAVGTVDALEDHIFNCDTPDDLFLKAGDEFGFDRDAVTHREGHILISDVRILQSAGAFGVMVADLDIANGPVALVLQDQGRGTIGTSGDKLTLAVQDGQLAITIAVDDNGVALDAAASGR